MQKLVQPAPGDSCVPLLILLPVLSAGTAIKWGTAWGTCYLNAEAEHCGSPLCERMAINIQGGLYATCAYSTDKTTSAAQFQDTCNSAGITGSVNWNEFNLQQVLTYLQVQSLAELRATCFGASGRRLQSTDAKTEEYHHETHTYYPGVALVLSGPMHVSFLTLTLSFLSRRARACKAGTKGDCEHGT